MGRARAKAPVARSLDEPAADFERLVRRAKRQNKRIERSYDDWQRWSLTIDEAMAVLETIVTCPATTMGELSTKFSVILKAIIFNRSIVDASDLQHLSRFGRDLERLQ
jgi:hypothetical protein